MFLRLVFSTNGNVKMYNMIVAEDNTALKPASPETFNNNDTIIANTGIKLNNSIDLLFFLMNKNKHSKGLTNNKSVLV